MKLTAQQTKRLNRVAAKSGITPAAWLKGVIDSALSNDEGHFREMADREAAERDVDRAQFGRASAELRNLQPGTLNQLVQITAAARLQGRAEAKRGPR